MILPDVRFESINPLHARRLVDAAVLSGPPGTTLYVLHETGKVLRAWHDVRGRVTLTEDTIVPSMELAARWSVEHDATDVRIVDLDARDRFLATVQDPARVFGLDGFEHFLRAHELKWGSGDGILVYPRRELQHHFLYARRTGDFIAKRLDPESVFLLGITEGKDWWSSLIVVLEKSRVSRVATFDDLPDPTTRVPMDGDAVVAFAREAARHYRRKTFVMLLDRESFLEHARCQWSGLGGLFLTCAEP
jgi:hypothetical protein